MRGGNKNLTRHNVIYIRHILQLIEALCSFGFREAAFGVVKTREKACL
jgi:hypothetical protein